MYIGIREARPGMTLAEDIELPKGAGLLQKSRQLSQEMINLLNRSGIGRINVIDPALRQAPPPATKSAPVPAAAPAASPAKAKNGAALAPAPEPEAKPVPPKLEVVISHDSMSARLTIDPASPASAELSHDEVMNALQAGGVLYGVATEMVPDIIQKWKSNKRHYEFDRIAKGTPPEPGKEGSFHLKVKFLSNVADVEAVHQSKFYWQAVEKLGKLSCVTAGTVIAEKLFDTPPIPGSNVLGEPLITEQMTPIKLTLGEGAAFSQDRKQIIAKSGGIVYQVSETIGVLAVNTNGSVEAAVAEDKMSASLIIHPPGEGGSMPPVKEIEALLINSRVLWGLNTKWLGELVEGFALGRFPAQPVVVAEGLPPKNGDNGKIEFLFNVNTSLQPKLNPDGSVDFKSINIVNTVAKGAELAKLLPPTKGTPGKNILGEELPCKEGNPVFLPMGPNTEPHPQKDDVLISSVDGVVRCLESHVEVSEGYVIPGDVDFSTGNVKYEKTVIINGDVKAGFSVECGGDLQVSGLIEDCTINVGGNVLCKHGFIGQGKGSIEAKGDVNIGFLMNQTVRSRKSVNIAKEAINSTIYARLSISVHGKPLSVAGGTLVARDSISVYSAGNQSGVRTNLEVGLDFTLVEELKKNEEQEIELTQKFRKLAESIKKYQHLAAVKKHFSTQEEYLFNKLKLAVAKISEQMRLLEERKKIIMAKQQELDSAFIKIEHAALPGTLFKIGERRFFVKEEVIGPKTVRLIRQEIHIL